jgi:tetratricopeptide (TPR) repeat protein
MRALGMLLLSACATPSWIARSTAHFDLYSDRDPGIVAEIGSDLEQFFDVFATVRDLGVPVPSPPPGRITVLVFSSKEDFNALYPIENAQAVYVTIENDLEPRPLIAMHYELGQDSREVVVHELSHRFLSHAAPAAPRWLAEGLAEYQSSMEIEKGQVCLGDGPRDVFHFNATVGPPAEVMQDRAGAQTYPAAFALVHLLYDTDEGAFQEYLKLLAQGSPPPDAFKQTLGRLDWKLLGSEMSGYLPRVRYKHRCLRYQARPITVSPERRMARAELHRLWAVMRPWSVRNVAFVAADLEEAERLEPGSDDTRFLRAALRLAVGDRAAAATELEPLQKQHPDELRVRMLVALLALKQDRQRVLAEIERLAPLATTPGSLMVLTQLFAAIGYADEALAACDKGLAQTPANDRLHEGRAWALHELGRNREAATEMAIAIGLSPHRGRDEKRERLLEAYRRAASSR